ncbi:MAG: DUF982 domain-containing protein [Rhizobiaceae bacterium]|nr:DUF982 domain-containing protein [Rhizobiaceae bacterium]
MNDLAFEKPVAVTAGLGTRLEVRNLMDMHRFLLDWPPSRRTSVYSTAVRACEAARMGHLTAEQARRAFESFAKCHQVLWPEVEPLIANHALRNAPASHA